MSVIEFKQKPDEPGYGGHNFMICGCQADKEEQEGYIPVVMHDAAGAFVAALVCPNCETEIQLVGGRLQD